MSAATQADLNCTYCGDTLDSEEAESPQHDESNDVMCDSCYDSHYRDYCSLCDEFVEKIDLDTSPGKLIVVFEEVPATGTHDLSPGYYRILKRPFFADGMIEGHFYGHALQRVLPLDEQGERAAKDASFYSGPMCSDCFARVEKSVQAGGIPV